MPIYLGGRSIFTSSGWDESDEALGGLRYLKIGPLLIYSKSINDSFLDL